MSIRFCAAALTVWCVTAPSSAIVIRHDVDPMGYVVQPADYPAVFGLLRTPRGFWDCPATLIAPDWAITAAHCAEAPRITSAVASSVGFEVNIAGAANRIDRIVRHPDPRVDLALLHLSTRSSAIAPVAIYRSNDEVGRILELLGWGDTGTGQTGPTGIDGQLRRARNVVEAVDHTTIMMSFDGPEGALPLEGISGPGDSGGPAFLATPDGLVLVGVSSAQDPMGRPRGTYGVREYYARISTAAAWIDRVITER